MNTLMTDAHLKNEGRVRQLYFKTRRMWRKGCSHKMIPLLCITGFSSEEVINETFKLCVSVRERERFGGIESDR